MRLFEEAHSSERLYGELLLASRDVAKTPRALAGAMLEAEFQTLVTSFIRGMAKN